MPRCSVVAVLTRRRSASLAESVTTMLARSGPKHLDLDH
jgi:hypothetical protein